MTAATDQPATGVLHRRFQPSDALLAIVATAVGIAVRLPLTLASPFPLGDGGLFLQMVDDLRRTFPALPATTTYNGLGIPFVYPPLAFYLAAALGNTFGIGTLDLLRWIPLVFSVLAVPAVYLLARRFFDSTAHAFIAAMAFAVIPRSYDWTIDGGGLTRAPGELFALLTLVAWLAAFERRRLRDWGLAGLGLGATAVTHPQAAIFAAVSMLVLLLFRGRSSWSRSGLATAAVGTFVVILPWLVGLVAIHGTQGISDVLSAGQRWEPVLGLQSLVDFDVNGGLFYVGPVMLGFAGLVACLLRGSYLLPVWAAAVFVAGAGGANFLAMPVVVLLIATFIVDVAIDPGSRALATRSGRLRTALVLSAVLGIALANGLYRTGAEDVRLSGMADAQRTAMTWVSQHTPENAHFVVVEPAIWGIVAEWFPVLAERQSANTLQGAEWLGRDRFQAVGEVAADVAHCATLDATCLEQIASADELTDAWVFIPKGTGDSGADCCLAIRQSLKSSMTYSLVYEGPGATVFAPRSRLTGSAVISRETS